MERSSGELFSRRGITTIGFAEGAASFGLSNNVQPRMTTTGAVGILKSVILGEVVD